MLYISFVFAVYCFFRAYLGYAYGYIPNSEEIDRYILKLKDYYESIKESDIEVKIENDIRLFLTSEYSKYSAINTQNNDEKSKYLHHSNVAIFISIVVLFLSLFPFYMAYHSTSEILKVELVNKSKEKKMRKVEHEQQQQQQQQQQQKPTPPAGRLIKEGEAPTRKK